MTEKNDNATPHRSSEYDDQILRTIPYYDRFHEETMRLVEACRPRPELWLDTGCGTGTAIEKYLDRFTGTKFILADPSKPMLELAQERLAGNGGISYLNAASQELTGLIEGKPDVITAVQVHHYLSAPERVKATRACFELLAEGGIYITFENVRPFTAEGTEIVKRNWGRYQTERGRSGSVVKKHLERFGVGYFPITAEEHLRLYRNCGFSAVELLWYSCMQAGFFCIK